MKSRQHGLWLLIICTAIPAACGSIVFDSSFTCNCVAYGINDLGSIVGTGPTNGSPTFLWNGSSFSTVTYPVGWSFEQPGGINNSGVISGGYYGSGHGHGFVDTGGSFATIDYPSATDTQVGGINNIGQVVGGFNSGLGGFLLSGGVFTPVTFPGSASTTANGVSDNGNIVGSYFGIGANPNGFLLSGGVYTPLAVPGATHTLALGINTSGVIVGYYDDTGGRHGFLYANGLFTSVNFPGATETQVLGVNNLGQFVGDYVNGTGTFGFLASSVPEPSSFALTVLGVLPMLLRRWSQSRRP